jgi:hypothetical protein
MLSTMPLSKKIIAKPYWKADRHLAKRFKNQQDYTGLEYSQSMIAIAKKK